MEKVTVNKTELLNALRDNREKHKVEFEEALGHWRETVLASANELAFQLSQDNWDMELNPAAGFPKPSHHLKDYDLAIRMLEMSVDDNIEIEGHEFNQYVMDDWHWKAGFDATTSIYNSRR